MFLMFWTPEFDLRWIEEIQVHLLSRVRPSCELSNIFFIFIWNSTFFFKNLPLRRVFSSIWTQSNKSPWKWWKKRWNSNKNKKCMRGPTKVLYSSKDAPGSPLSSAHQIRSSKHEKHFLFSFLSKKNVFFVIFKDIYHFESKWTGKTLLEGRFLKKKLNFK